MEEWLPVNGFEGRYEVSSLGRLRNTKTQRFLKGWHASNGYLMVQFGKAMPRKIYLIHRLVAEAFVPGDKSLQVNHLNGVRDDNPAKNLEWASCSDNHKHSYQKLPRKRPYKKVGIFKDQVVHVFESGVAAAHFLKVVPGSIGSAALKKHRCKGWSVTYV